MEKLIETYFLAHLREGSDDCLLWDGPLRPDGYGLLAVQRNKKRVQLLAHRYAWTRAHGPIPAGLLIDHSCRVYQCVWVGHLRLATQKQNQENRRGPNKNSTTGVRNVRWDATKQNWFVRIKHNGKTFTAGRRFDDLTEAAEAAVALREQLFTHL